MVDWKQVEAVEQLMRAAQAKLGLSVALSTLDYWEAVSKTSPGSSGSGWARRTAEAAYDGRGMSARLSKAYYSLTRALQVGATVSERAGDKTISTLVDEFLDTVQVVMGLGGGTDWAGADAMRRSLGAGHDRAMSWDSIDLAPMVAEVRSIGGGAVPVEVIDWGRDVDGDEFLRRMTLLLTGEGTDPLEEKLSWWRRDGIELADAERLVNDAYAKAGSRAAGQADEAAMRMGRAIIDRTANRDRRAASVARATSSTPCPFCAMLAGRGFVYRTTESAGFGASGPWHPNCHCYPVVRFSKDSPLPVQAQFFADLWQKEIAGNFSGAEARNEWRKLLTALKAKSESPGGSKA